jgi:quercetin dioxygenase-like cupin family protein
MEYGRAIIVDGLRSLELEPSRPSIYDRDIGVRTLHEDPNSGAEHYLIRYPPGLKTRLHRHTFAHTFVVVEGQLEANGQIVGPGSYCHFEAGEPMRHEPAGEDSCLFVAVLDAAGDTEPLSE